MEVVSRRSFLQALAASAVAPALPRIPLAAEPFAFKKVQPLMFASVYSDGAGHEFLHLQAFAPHNRARLVGLLIDDTIVPMPRGEPPKDSPYHGFARINRQWLHDHGTGRPDLAASAMAHITLRFNPDMYRTGVPNLVGLYA